MKTHETSLLTGSFPSPLFSDIEGSEMKKINVIDFYQMGNWLGYLRLIKAGKPTQDTCNYLYNAQLWLEKLCKHPANIIEFELSKPAAQDLLNVVVKLLSKIILLEIGCEVRPDEVENINAALTRFELVLVEETRELATFYVSKKRNYSTQGLIEHADNEFPDAVKKRLSPQAITTGYSKKFEYLTHSINLMVFYYNFIWIHGAHNQTPAQSANLTNKQWSFKDLLLTPD